MGEVIAVLCATFDAWLEDAVRRRVAAVAAAGVKVRSPARHPPHLTLAAAKIDASSLDEVAQIARQVATGQPAVPIVLEHLGVFPAGGVLWLGPRPEAGLAQLQRAADTALVTQWPRAFGEQTRPDHWVPHCTVATRLDPTGLGRAVEVSTRARRPLRGTISALSTIVVGGDGVHASARLGRSEGDVSRLNRDG